MGIWSIFNLDIFINSAAEKILYMSLGICMHVYISGVCVCVCVCNIRIGLLGHRACIYSALIKIAKIFVVPVTLSAAV